MRCRVDARAAFGKTHYALDYSRSKPAQCAGRILPVSAKRFCRRPDTRYPALPWAYGVGKSVAPPVVTEPSSAGSNTRSLRRAYSILVLTVFVGHCITAAVSKQESPSQ